MPSPALTPVISPAPSSPEAPADPLPAIVASGRFNVYPREQFSTRKLTFGRRDYYKISLLTGSSRYNYANRGVLIDRPALVFSNPLIPYSWEPVSEVQGGYLCMFSEEFLIVNDRAASLQESPLFRLGSDPVSRPPLAPMWPFSKRCTTPTYSAWCRRRKPFWTCCAGRPSPAL
jgi:hypothetical protein